MFSEFFGYDVKQALPPSRVNEQPRTSRVVIHTKVNISVLYTHITTVLMK